MFSLEDAHELLSTADKHDLIHVGGNATFKRIIIEAITEYEKMLVSMEPNHTEETPEQFQRQYADLARYRNCLLDILGFLNKQQEWMTQLQTNPQESNNV